MGSDWHTRDGMRSLERGKEAEAVLHRRLAETDGDIQWPSQSPQLYFLGYDIVWRGLRIEVKSNGGWDAVRGRPYETVCVELETKVGRPIGWTEGKADIVAFINIWEGACYLYKADELVRFLSGRRRFSRHDAQCTVMKWDEGRAAGFVKKLSLNLN